MSRILLVEADQKLVETLSGLLRAEGFAVEVAMDADLGFDKASADDFELVILSEAVAGLAICAALRKAGIDTSILMLAERRVLALRLGADDCVSRTCDPSELMARVEALLRRVPKASRGPMRMARFGDVKVDFGLGEVWKGNRLVRLSGKELRLLQYLISHRQKVVTREELLRNVWEYDTTISSRTVDVHVGWLRQKLEDDPQRPRHIKTIRGLGYRFDQDDAISDINFGRYFFIPTGAIGKR